MPMKVTKKQPLSKNCIICGIDNPYGVHASFYELEDNSVCAIFSFSKYHQSYPERTHGGLISAIIDETIGRAIWINDPKAFGCTIKLNISFHKAVPYDEKLYCIGRIDKVNNISFGGHAEIKNQKGELLARGEALYMRLKLEQISPHEAQNNHSSLEELNVEVPDDIKEIDLP